MNGADMFSGTGGNVARLLPWTPKTISDQSTSTFVNVLTAALKKGFAESGLNEIAAGESIPRSSADTGAIVASVSIAGFRHPVACRVRTDDLAWLCALAFGARPDESWLAGNQSPIVRFIANRTVETFLDLLCRAALQFRAEAVREGPVESVDPAAWRNAFGQHVTIADTFGACDLYVEYFIADDDLRRLDSGAGDTVAGDRSALGRFLPPVIENTELRLQALLEDREATLLEIRSWRVGVVVQLRATPASTASLVVAGRALFRCQIARHDEILALRIIDTETSPTRETKGGRGKMADGFHGETGENGGKDASSGAWAKGVIERIPLTLRVVLGSVSMSVGEAGRLTPGSLVKLDRLVGQPVELMVNDRAICRGDVGVSEESPPRFLVKITEMIDGRQDPDDP